MILVNSFTNLWIGKKWALKSLICCKSFIGICLKQLFQKNKDFLIDLATLRFIKQVPNNFFIEKTFTLNMKWQWSYNQRICNNSKRVNITLLRVSFGILLIYSHYLWSYISHRSALVIQIVLCAYRCKTEIAKHPHILFFSVYDVFWLNISMHNVFRT
jgi:hypothetical protein